MKLKKFNEMKKWDSDNRKYYVVENELVMM